MGEVGYLYLNFLMYGVVVVALKRGNGNRMSAGPATNLRKMRKKTLLRLSDAKQCECRHSSLLDALAVILKHL